MSYNSLRKEIYENMEFEEGFRIPIANEKNKKLENKVFIHFLQKAIHLEK